MGEKVMTKPIRIDGKPVEDPLDWIEKRMCEHGLPYLLAHADDGVIWGRRNKGNGLVLSGQVFPELKVELRAKTLQELRLFGPAGEIFLWRTEDGFATRPLLDGSSPSREVIDDLQLLWGRAKDAGSGFTCMEEGERGLRHAPPLDIPNGKRACILVRHYLDHDEEGQTFIAYSRLVDLKTEEEDGNGAQAQ